MRITQIYLIFQWISYLCNRSLIVLIGDFWIFSEISKKILDNFIRGWYRNKILKKINFVVLPFHKFK